MNLLNRLIEMLYKWSRGLEQTKYEQLQDRHLKLLKENEELRAELLRNTKHHRNFVQRRLI